MTGILPSQRCMGRGGGLFSYVLYTMKCAPADWAFQGENCSTSLDMYTSITKDQFIFWNPALGGDYGGLLNGYWYCIANFNASDIPMLPVITNTIPSPTASGSGNTQNVTCRAWYLATANDDCKSVALSFGNFVASDFVKWNPDVWSDCSNMEARFHRVSTYLDAVLPAPSPHAN